jgi:hypothetical protein
MAVISKVFSRTAAATSNTTLYTTTAGSTAVVTNILATNTGVGSGTFTVNFNSVAAYSGVVIDGNTTVSIDLKQVLASGQTITGSASTTAINFHISGVEIV